MLLSSNSFLIIPHFFKSIPEFYLPLAHGVVVFFVLLVFSVLYRLSLKPTHEEIIPSERFNLKNLFQFAIEQLLSLMKSIIPHHAEDFFPIIGAIFIYIFVSNLLGLIPGFLPPTESINTNLAVAFTIFVYYHYVGIKRTGFKNYSQHFIGPSVGNTLGLLLFRFLFLMPLLFMVEIISHTFRVVSLSLRLFGNINGDHMVLATFSDMMPIAVPLVFIAFGLFVSFIQAFIFTLLSTVYIGLAIETHDH